MRLLVSWVRDFVDVTAPVDEIAEKLALRGFEVASVEPRDEGDGVIDFEVTANRPDCLSVIGFAREIATVYQLPFRPPSSQAGALVPLAQVAVGEPEGLVVSLEDPELCPRYAAAVVEVTKTASPEWMTSRLQAADVRVISPFVDITNYVLLELGHPMHAFDLETLAGRELRIRRAGAGEIATTLDGVERKLESDMLVIADGRRAQAIAGVMGGASSEVSGSTRTVAFESAYFKPSSIRRTSKRLGLKTEASARFERGADVNAPVIALQRALALMAAIGAGRPIGPIVDRYPLVRGPKTIHLRRHRIALLLGMRVPDADVERMLASLGLTVTPVSDGWDVVVPTFRVDLLREVDLIEEVGRHHGFDKLEPTFPVMAAAAAPPDPRILRDHLARRVLTAAGLSEAVTFGFVEEQAAQAFVADADRSSLVTVANPLSAKFDTMRPSLLPGLVDAVAYNRRHGRRDVALFEIGARFSSATGESRAVGVAWTGAAAHEHWSGTAREVDFFDIKGVVERLGEALGAEVRLQPCTVPYLVEGQAAHVLAGDQPVGIVGVLAPALVEKRGAPRQDGIVIAELDLDRLPMGAVEAVEKVRVPPRHPAVVRDLSIVVADTLPAENIRDTIQAAGARTPAPLVSVTFFDRYRGKGVAEGAVSLSLRLTFQASDRTLTDADVQQSFDRIVAALVSGHQAVQR